LLTRGRTTRSVGIACGIFLLVALVAAASIWQLERARLQHERALVSGFAKDHARHLEVYIQRALSATYALAALVRLSHGNIPNFDEVAEQMLPLYPGDSELVLAVGGRIQKVFPSRGNEAAVGLDLLRSPAQRDEARRTRDSGKLTLSGPLQLVEGGLGLVGRLPVSLSDAQGKPSFWGFTEVVMRLPEALEPAQLAELAKRGYAYQLWKLDSRSRRQVIAASTTTPLSQPVEQSLQVPNGTWTLDIAPVLGWREPRGLALEIGLGLTFSLLVAYLAWSLLDWREHSQTHLSVTLDAAKISMWDWDIKHNRWRASPTYFTNLGYPPENGQPDPAVWLERVHPEDRSKVTDANQAVLTGRNDRYDYEVRLRHADGSYRWASARGRVVKWDINGRARRMLGVRIDITEQKAAEERIRRLAHFDSLTGLPNRTLLNDRMHYALAMAARKQEPLAMLVLNIDKFKNVNDTFGHRVGDELLMEVARRMTALAREDDTAARVGGDEFILALPGLDAHHTAHLAQQLLDSLSRPYRTQQLELVVTLSIGIALFPSDGSDVETLLKCADTAMHRAKEHGRNQYVFCTPEMQILAARNLLLENALHGATERGEFQLYYQPQISLTDGRIRGVEALLRWDHPDLGRVPPGEFIPIAEDSGQILQIGTWVLRSAVAQMRTWIDRGLEPLNLAVNLSAVQFRHPNLPELIAGVLAEARLPARCLELELTEGVAMGDPVRAIEVLDKLHRLGVRISLDDFGTGYSSLNYLKRFRASKLKIDQSFVSGVTNDSEDQGIVAAIIKLADSLGLETVAEGVETPGQLTFLQTHGCREAQGYYFSEPLPPERLEALATDMDRQAAWLKSPLSASAQC
jgi:diguanylate cyclase (GGDEF)-like protein/PAS domain S-box-containing protein